jgi:hypothetical protein
MQRDRVAVMASTAALAIAILVWFEIFAFAKIVHMPKWAGLLPSPLWAPCVVALPFLVPATWLTTSLGSAARSLVWVGFLSPLPALAIYALNPLHQHSGLLLNLAFQYVWLFGVASLLPGGILLSARAILRFAVNRLTNARRRRAKTHAPQA